MSQKQMTRKERERQRHRKEIMAAAEKVFAEKGYHESSIQDIANTAEFSVGTIYNFFANKEALFSSILKEGLADLQTQVDQRLAATKCPVEKIRHTVASQMEVAEEHKHFLRILFDYNRPMILNKREEIDDEIITWHQDFLDKITGMFEEAISQGKIISYNPRFLAIGLDGIMVNFIEQFPFLDGIKSYKDLIPIIDKMFLERILVRS